MTNPYYAVSGTPATSSAGASAPMRSEFIAVQSGFDKFPDFTALSPGVPIVVNGGSSGFIGATGVVFGSGTLGLGMTPVNVLDITQTQNSTSQANILNASSGAAASTGYRQSNGTHISSYTLTGASYTPTVNYDFADGVYLVTDGAGGLNLATVNGTASMKFFTGAGGASAERMRIDPNGALIIGTTIYDATRKLIVTTSAAASNPVEFYSTNATPGATFIVETNFNSASPNNATASFIAGADNSATRFLLYSNGGLANFSANNVNLSDARVKSAFQRYDNAELDVLQTGFLAVDWGKFKFDDQTHDDWNHGYTAQGVEAAFGTSAPELVDDVGLGPKDGQKLKGVYDTDLGNIGMALLARLLNKNSELENKNSELESQVSQLENKNSELESQVSQLENRNLELENRVSTLEARLGAFRI